MMFNIIFLLLLFNSHQTNSTNSFAHDDQFLIEEDLLLIKDNINNDSKLRLISENVTSKVLTTETTQELGSGSPDITTTFSPTYFNTSISTIITGFSTTEIPFTSETTEEPTTFETTSEETTNETTEPITEQTTIFETNEDSTRYETTISTTELSTQGLFTTENVTTFTITANNTNISTLLTTPFEETTTKEPTTEETTLNDETTLIEETTSKEQFSSETTTFSTNTNLFSTQASLTTFVTTNASNFTNITFEETTVNLDTITSETTSQFPIFPTSSSSEFTTTVHTSVNSSPRVIVTSESSTNAFVEETTQQTSVSQASSITSIPTTSITTVFVTTEQQTTATTTALASLLVGSSDVSLRSSWENIDNYASYSIYLTDDQIPLNLLGQTYSTFAIHPNGFISLGSTSIDVQSPSASINSYTVPIISPFWFASYIGTDSDITYGRYDAANMDLQLKSKVSELISGLFQERVIQKSRSPRSINRVAPRSIDIIYLITWKNLHFYTNTSSQTATFQLVLATSVSDSKTYAIYWYPDGGLKWNSNDVVVFIGYVSGTRSIQNVVSQFSNLINTRAIPARIYYDQGNTNKIGTILYDMRYGPSNVDPCTSWADQANIQNKKNPLKNSANFINCPGTAIGALYHPYFDLYQGKTWQTASNISICFILSTDVFRDLKYQQFCCYDYTNYNYNGALITEGYNAGFSYNSRTIIELIGNGTICCQNKNANLCNKFYKLFTRQSNERKKNKIVGSNADIQFTTFDGLTYTFNGYGQFVLAKASDFEIQGETKISVNAKDPSKQLTFFNAMAFKTQNSMIFEVRINDANINAPILDIYVNRSNTPLTISNPIEYYSSFNCLINTTNVCNSIYMTNSSYMKIIFVNGLTLTIQLFTVPVNQAQIQTWLSISVKLINTDIDYTNSLSGLFGNFNNIKGDDITSRSGTSIPSNSRTRDIYSTAITWKVDPTIDSKLFLKSNTRMVRQAATGFTPTFLEDLVAQNPTLAQQVNETCNYIESCVVATLTSGLDAIGAQSRASVQQYQSALNSLSLEPPSISFRNKSVTVDWSINAPLIIIADVFSSDPNTLTNVSVTVSNAAAVSNVQTVVNSTYYVVTITYQPQTGEYPTFQITAVDSKNLTVSISLPELLICNCRSLDPLNECLYTSIQFSVNPFVRLVACNCDSYYSGAFCNQTKDYCSLGDWCTIYPGYNTNITCTSLSVSVQKATGLSYNCTGICSAGFYKDKNGACQDVNECLNSTCPSDSICVNQIGSSTCSCANGYIYRKANNTCQFIDLCKTNRNNCDQICTPIVGNFNCSCYNGYIFNATTNKCDTSAALANCNCGQICALDTNNNIQCKCRSGYSLNPADNTTCLDIDECTSNPCNSPSTCTNLIGSYTCTCPKGYQLDVDGASCIECPFGTYGFNCNQTCNCAYSTGCDSVSGCVCQPGYNGTNCDNLLNLCPSGTFNETTTQCLTFQGYYQLICLPGYEKSGTDDNCTAINYCSALRNICPSDATCVQLNGGFTCKCSSGYIYDSGTNKCVDENECALNKSNCPINSQCQNIVGNYICTCNKGFASNVNDTTNRNPNCTNINECIFSNICAANLTCQDTIGSYNCLCFDGTIAVNGLCNFSVTTTTTASSNLSEQSTPVAVGLILSIVLPIGIVLVLSILAALVCYFWFKMRAEKLAKQKSKETYAQSLQKNLNNLGSKQPIEKSMFQRIDYNEDDLDSNYLNNFQEDYNDIINGANQNGIRSIYRPSYLFEEGVAKSDTDFFKSLEDLASSSQHTTIARPQSVFSDSSISLPTAYYEHTTPYLRSTFPQFDIPDNSDRIDELEEPDDEIIKNNDLDYDDDIELNNFEDLFDNDADVGDLVEAFNPNVKIPRPKLQFNPSKLFKFGPSPGESDQ